MHEEGNTPGAFEHAQTALDLDPENAEAYLVLGMLHLERGTFDEAESSVLKGVEILGEAGSSGATLAEARNLLGAVFVERRKYAEAAEAYRASAADPLNRTPHLAWGNLGRVRILQGRPADALEPLLVAVRHQPRFCLGFLFLGEAYYQLDRFEEAEQALVQATEADESCADDARLQRAWRLRGETRARLGHREEAVQDFERCVELGPNSDDGRACQRVLEGAAAP
jgi:tetratricopeptide (TPR) repeat protein